MKPDYDENEDLMQAESTQEIVNRVTKQFHVDKPGAEKAWFTFNDHCEKVGIIAGAYTAFLSGYGAGHLDAEMEQEAKDNE